MAITLCCLLCCCVGFLSLVPFCNILQTRDKCSCRLFNCAELMAYVLLLIHQMQDGEGFYLVQIEHQYVFWGERGRYRDITKKGFPSRLSKHTPLVLYTSCLQIVFKLTPLAKVFTFSRKVFFIFNIFSSSDLSTRPVQCSNNMIPRVFLTRPSILTSALCVVHSLSVPHVVAVFIFFTHSDTISIMLLEFSPPFFFVHWSGRNVIWKAIEARSISRKKG